MFLIYIVEKTNILATSNGIGLHSDETSSPLSILFPPNFFFSSSFMSRKCWGGLGEMQRF